MSPVPRLDLAPKRTTPLSLWNPLDYLELLYWVFFFPQALRWYVEKFGTVKYEGGKWREFLNLLRVDSVQRNLLFQSLTLILVFPLAFTAGIQALGVHVNWGVAMVGMGGGVLMIVTFSLTRSVASNVASGVALGVAVGMGSSISSNVADRPAFVMALGGALGIALSVMVGVEGGIETRMPRMVALSLVFGVMLSAMAAMAFSMMAGAGMIAVTILVALLRVADYGLVALPYWVTRGRWGLSRTVYLPLPGLRARLRGWLAQNPPAALHNANELLAYSLQFNPVMQAVNDWLAGLPNLQILPAVNQLAEEPFDWDLVRFGSASLRVKLEQEFIRGGSVFFEKWTEKWRTQRFNAEPRLDTPTRAACAGYWYWHITELEKALTAFEEVRHLPHGPELYQLALALEQAHILGSTPSNIKDLVSFCTFADSTRWLEAPLPEEPLRPTSLATLRRLRQAALEAQVASESLSKLQRTTALGRAVGGLTQLIDDVEQTCPYPEWPIVKAIATQWREILARAGGEAGQLTITQPVDNPFVASTPVSGKLFVGREPIFERLEELWGANEALPVTSVVLYGHRRMGKTSILQNLGRHQFGARTLTALFNMQRAGRATTGDLLLELAHALHGALTEAGLPLAEPLATEYGTNGYVAFNRYVSAVKTAINGRRIILAIDEFELIERGIAEGRIDAELLGFLRGVIHSEPWFILALAGLHTLEEMTADYWNPLFASVTPVKVGFLSPGAAGNLLANPTDDFPLDVTREAAEHAYAWTRGQPFLTQLIGHTLVRLYNQSVFEQNAPREARFSGKDVEAVVNQAEFYEQGSYYFLGLWQQAEDKAAAPGQIPLLRALAAHDAPVDAAALYTAAALDATTGAMALAALEKHDVVYRTEAGAYDFTVPLLRKWLRERAPR